MNKIRLFHIECLGIMRDIVKVVLETTGEIEVVAQQEHTQNLDMIFQWEDIDIVLIGTNKNDAPQHDLIREIDLCRDIRKRFPAIKIILHSSINDARNICQLMNAGANAVVSKHTGYLELLNAVRTVKANDRYINNEISHFFKNTFEYLEGRVNTLVEKEPIFTQRELEVLSLVSSGRTNKEIAEQLFISYKTVETHRKNLISKSKSKNTAELISFCYNHSLL